MTAPTIRTTHVGSLPRSTRLRTLLTDPEGRDESAALASIAVSLLAMRALALEPRPRRLQTFVERRQVLGHPSFVGVIEVGPERRQSGRGAVARRPLEPPGQRLEAVVDHTRIRRIEALPTRLARISEGRHVGDDAAHVGRRHHPLVGHLTGEGAIRFVADGDDDGIPDDDVALVAENAGVDAETAREALAETDGDLAAAIARLE